MNLRQIIVGGIRVGLVGLDEIFEEVKASNLESDDEIAEMLLELTSKHNYITPSRKEDYRRALLREFKIYLGEEAPKESGLLEIRILGKGCPRCEKLMEEVLAALSQLDLRADVEHVKDLGEISKYGPVASPALVINGKVVAMGRVLSKNEIIEILKQA
ncbi:MAG: thioredoxin family protein [bacterium]